MNILLIHQYFLEEDDPGGSRWNEFTRVWTAQGHTITVLAGMMHYNGKEKRPEYKGKYFVKKQQGSVTVLRCHVSEAYNKHFIGRLWGYFSFMFSSLYAGLFKAKGKYDNATNMKKFEVKQVTISLMEKEGKQYVSKGDTLSSEAIHELRKIKKTTPVYIRVEGKNGKSTKTVWNRILVYND